MSLALYHLAAQRRSFGPLVVRDVLVEFRSPRSISAHARPPVVRGLVVDGCIAVDRSRVRFVELVQRLACVGLREGDALVHLETRPTHREPLVLSDDILSQEDAASAGFGAADLCTRGESRDRSMLAASVRQALARLHAYAMLPDPHLLVVTDVRGARAIAADDAIAATEPGIRMTTLLIDARRLPHALARRSNAHRTYAAVADLGDLSRALRRLHAAPGIPNFFDVRLSLQPGSAIRRLDSIGGCARTSGRGCEVHLGDLREDESSVTHVRIRHRKDAESPLFLELALSGIALHDGARHYALNELVDLAALDDCQAGVGCVPLFRSLALDDGAADLAAFADSSKDDDVGSARLHLASAARKLRRSGASLAAGVLDMRAATYRRNPRDDRARRPGR